MVDDSCPYAAPDSVAHSRKSRLRAMLFSLGGVFLIIIVLASLMLPAVRQARGPARLTQCRNNLKQIGLALHNYHDVYGAFPPAHTVDENGTPLHSWRTLILPFIEAGPLLDSIDLSKPWDDPVNANARGQVPYAYRCPSAVVPENFTTYCGIVGEGRCFHPTHGRRLSEIRDGAANTLMVIEVSQDKAVHWMEPRDTDDWFLLTFGEESDFAHQGGTHGMLADGSVRFLSSGLSGASRGALATIAAEDVVGEE